jgi:hypothetical protein
MLGSHQGVGFSVLILLDQWMNSFFKLVDIENAGT